MDRNEKIRRLQKKLAGRAPTPGAPSEEGLEAISSFKALEGPAHDENRLLETLKGHPDLLTQADVDGLEAIVNRDNPVVDIVKDSFATPPWPYASFGESATRTLIEQAIKSVGRVEMPGRSSVPYAGTAFVVGEGLLMTNRHVAQQFAAGLGQTGLTFLPGQTAEIDLVQEIVPRDSVPLVVKRVVMIHPYWDMALLEVEGLPAGRYLQLSGDDVAAGSPVAVIGYPAFSSLNDAQLQVQMFRNRFEVKRLLPGKLKGVEPIKSFGKVVAAVGHDSTTLGGNSGSAVIDVATGLVVGLHFAGSELVMNYAVPSWELARDPRVVDQGVKFTKTPAPGAPPPPWQEWWTQAEALAPAGAPPRRERPIAAASPPLPPPKPSRSSEGAPPSGGTVATFRFDVPIEITVSIGAPRPGAGAGRAPEVAVLVDASQAPGLGLESVSPASLPLLPQDDGPERRTALAGPRSTWEMKLGALGPTVGVQAVPPIDRPSASWVKRAALRAGLIALNEIEVRAAWVFGAPSDAPVLEGLESLDDEASERARIAERIRSEKREVEAFMARAAALDGDDAGLESIGGEETDLDAVTRALERRLAEILGPGIAAPPIEEGFFRNLGADLRAALLGPRGRPRDVRDYAKLFRAIERPAIAESWQRDEMFAWQRLAGPNAALIRRAEEVPDRLNLTDARFRAVMGDEVDSLAAARDERRLFVCDYAALSTLRPGRYDNKVPKFVSTPLALFAVPRSGGRLRPVAIHAEGVTSTAAVFFPSDGQAWKLARSVVQIADGNHHELVGHLARTHLYVEVFLLATRRHLAPNHPLHALLVPHFEGTLFINDNARGSLIHAGGAIDKIFAGTIDSSQKLAAEGLASYDFLQFMLPRQLAGAGTEQIRDYPYRDDALLLWNAIREWVRQYVAHVYADPRALADDWELRSWNAQLRQSVAQGGIPGFPLIETLEQLVDALSFIIFIPSCQHAAVNFPQLTDMCYAPALSGAGWRAGSGAPASITKEARLDFMPPLELALRQLDTLALLGGVHHTPLGEYRSNRWPYGPSFRDPVVTGTLLPAFQQRLRGVEATIAARNASPARWLPYVHLLPSRVPMSINI